MEFKDGQWMYNDPVSSDWFGPVFDTKEEAIAAGTKYYEGDLICFRVGRIKTHKIQLDIPIDSVIEELNSQILLKSHGSEEHDKVEFLEHDGDVLVLSSMLSDALKKWMDLYARHPKTYTIDLTEEVIPESQSAI